MKHQINTSKFLYTPMLSIAGNSYQRPITDGLWTILSRARLVAREDERQLITQGYQLKLNIQGKPKGTQAINFVIYHVPFDQNADKSMAALMFPELITPKLST